MIRLPKPHRGAVPSITLDNGSEFAGHEAVAKAVAAATYCSSQRETNENINGQIRQYLPKGTEFRQITDTEMGRMVKKLNDRPESDSATGHRHRCFWDSTQGH